MNSRNRKKQTKTVVLQSLFWGVGMFLMTTFVEPNFRDDLDEVDPIYILRRLVICLLVAAGIGFIGYYTQKQKDT